MDHVNGRTKHCEIFATVGDVTMVSIKVQTVVDATVVAWRRTFRLQAHEFRARTDRTQVSVAAEAGIDPAVYVNTESGKNKISLGKVFALVDALDIDEAEPFCGGLSTAGCTRSTVTSAAQPRLIARPLLTGCFTPQRQDENGSVS
ncbi:helix-turn-helix domain-containing protein [Streptomyces flaveolus]|uniref:helix-turn-helix domain-containing protein n=1 Tax=Streptomyces flaveolus TaxID=67297 RepID=UPI0037F4F256